MSSILKVNTIQDGGGNAIITSDGSGNFTTQNILTPAFHVQDSAEQVVSDNTVTKVTYGGASIDTDSGWDTSNERWTVPSGKAGKYFITTLLNIYSSTALDAGSNYIRVNGTTIQTGYMDSWRKSRLSFKYNLFDYKRFKRWRLC